jgi:hypothetical protein
VIIRQDDTPALRRFAPQVVPAGFFQCPYLPKRGRTLPESHSALKAWQTRDSWNVPWPMAFTLEIHGLTDRPASLARAHRAT